MFSKSQLAKMAGKCRITQVRDVSVDLRRTREVF